jgi:hypothetical protein
VEAASAVDVLSAREDVGDLLRDADSVVVGYRSRPDVDSLLWRYDRCLADYRAVAEHRAGRLDGLAIFRCRRRGALWELSVCELFVRPGDDEMARRLLRRVAQSAQVDYVAVVAGASLPGALLTRAGYVRSPVGRIPVGVIPYEQYELDPTSPSSWSMSLGDLERLQLC